MLRSYFCAGEMAERSNAAVLKTVDCNRSGGSNPSLSALRERKLRKIVEKDKNQGEVWSKVDEINLKNKTQTSTNAYTAITISDSFTSKLNGYLKFFENKLTNPNIIGVIVVTGNRVMGCDLFATNAIFRSQYPSLLHSYATEAILNGAPVNIAAAIVKKYSDQLFKDETTQTQMLKEKGNAFFTNGKKLRISCFD
jgi:ARG and Rhodanese-Phosphatase-superfamily-associated Protein domain